MKGASEKDLFDEHVNHSKERMFMKDKWWGEGSRQGGSAGARLRTDGSQRRGTA